MSAKCGLTNRCSGRRAVPVPLLANVSILVGKKRASHLAPLSSNVRPHEKQCRIGMPAMYAKADARWNLVELAPTDQAQYLHLSNYSKGN